MASGIVSIWAGAPDDVGPAAAALEVAFPGRFLLGIGTSHRPGRGRLPHPYSKMVAYLDALGADPGGTGAPRTAGASCPRAPHAGAGGRPRRRRPPVRLRPGPEHTARARGILGPDPLLATEVAVVVETDPIRARELALLYAGTYLGLPNYTQNLRTFGFGDDDIGGGGGAFN